MRLIELVKKYPHVRLATPDQNQPIADFLKSTPLNFGNVSVHYEFADSIWRFLKCQGENSLVFTLVDNSQITGYAVISVREYSILGKKHKAGYISDLRVAKWASNESRSQWKECVNEIFSNPGSVDEFQDVTYFYAAVFKRNAKALKVFHSDKFPVLFHPILAYQAVTILGRKPLKLLSRRKRSNQFTILNATLEDLNNLRIFLHNQNHKKFWGEYFALPTHNEVDEWQRRMNTWHPFSIEDFYVAKDNDGKILFSTLPWAPHHSRKLVVDKISFLYIILGKLSKLIGKKGLELNAPLSNTYLTHMEFDCDLTTSQKIDIFSQFLDKLYQNKIQKHSHGIIFCDYYDEAIKTVLKQYIHITADSEIYQILSKSNQIQKIDSIDNFNKQMAFEAAIV